MGACLTEQPRLVNLPNLTQHLPERTVQLQCNVCLQSIPRRQQMCLSCSHIFHKQCLQKAYTVRIYQRNFPMKCPDCNTEVNYYILKNLLSQELFILYEKVLLINILLLDQHRFFCPTPDCPAIYEIIPSQFRYFECLACKKEFCLVCHKKYHGKTECQVQTKQEIANLSRECPKCKSDWFKTTGCNHVVCKVCKHQFCYKCGGSSCGTSTCNNNSNR